MCNIFLSFLFVDMCSLKIIALIFAQRSLNQKRLRLFDVKSAKRRRRFLDYVNLRLILSQWLMINASCDFFWKRILVLICKYAKWSFINCIYVSTSKNWLSVTCKTSFIILNFCFWRLINLLINIVAMSNQSWNAC